MCNRYRLTASQREIAERYGVELPYPEDVDIPPPELFPKRRAWVVRDSEAGRVLDVMTWGFPTVVKGATGKPIEKPVTNVRNLTSPFWRSALTNPERRCLVPVTTFCEWEGETGSKRDRWFSLPASPIFSFAGVWRPTEKGPAFAFLTCGYLGDPAQHVVGAVHPKACPVILHQEDEAPWLAGEPAEPFACAYPSQLITARGAA